MRELSRVKDGMFIKPLITTIYFLVDIFVCLVLSLVISSFMGGFDIVLLLSLSLLALWNSNHAGLWGNK